MPSSAHSSTMPLERRVLRRLAAGEVDDAPLGVGLAGGGGGSRRARARHVIRAVVLVVRVADRAVEVARARDRHDRQLHLLLVARARPAVERAALARPPCAAARLRHHRRVADITPSYQSAFEAISTSAGPWTSHTLRMTTRPPVRHSSAGADALAHRAQRGRGPDQRPVTRRACHSPPRGARTAAASFGGAGRAGARGRLLELAVAHPHRPAGARGDLRVVRDDEQRDVLGARQRVHHGGGRRGVEAAGRLVGEDQPRPVDEGARDGGALRLADRELRGAGVRAGGEAEPLEQLVGAGERGAPVAGGPPRRERHVLARAQVIEQVVLLEHEAEPGQPHLGARGVRCAPRVLAGQPHGAAVGAIEEADHLQERGLAAAARAHQRDRLGAGDRERGAADDLAAAEPAGEPVDGEHRRGQSILRSTRAGSVRAARHAG